jgi:hypothetical protein
MVPWAEHLKKSANAALFTAAKEEAKQGAITIASKIKSLDISVLGLSGMGRMAPGVKEKKVRKVITEGGCIVVARTSQLAYLVEQLSIVNEHRATPIVPVITLDESDTMLGCALSLGDERRDRSLSSTRSSWLRWRAPTSPPAWPQRTPSGRARRSSPTSAPQTPPWRSRRSRTCRTW